MTKAMRRLFSRAAKWAALAATDRAATRLQQSRQAARRAAAVLLAVMLTAATAWATTESVKYIDADGNEQTVTATVLTGEETVGQNNTINLAAGWYVVKSNISYTGDILADGVVKLILADGKTMNVGTEDDRVDGSGIRIPMLIIYGQTNGTGALSVYATGNAIRTSFLYIYGGNITANTNGNNCYAILSSNGGIPINRATVSATATGTSSTGIFARYAVDINGSTVTATGTAAGIYADGGNITLGWNKPTDRISITASSYSGTVKVMDGKKMTDGTNIYDDATTSETLEALTNTALYPYIENLALAANAHDGNYWTTFYCGHTGYKIDDGENATAYTAEYDSENSQLTLHKLGKVIPKQTAVILIGEDNSIGMTASTDPAENSVGNDLHGVDVRTACDDISTTGTFYVMGKQGDDFGFFEYTADYMPARKAYVRIDGGAALARSLTMVFGDEQTGITATTLTDGTKADDAWYTLDGRRLNGKPTKSGVYVNNGKKVVIK